MEKMGLELGLEVGIDVGGGEGEVIPSEYQGH